MIYLFSKETVDMINKACPTIEYLPKGSQVCYECLDISRGDIVERPLMKHLVN